MKTSTNGSATATDDTSTGILVGKYFHTTSTCPGGCRVPEWQGQILGQPSPGLLLVELFEWIMGQPSGQELITIADFAAKSPVLYDTADHMHFSYEDGAMGHRCEQRGCREDN